jgi:hypothetical protein
VTITLHQASVPLFQKMLRNLSTFLDKGAAFAAHRKFDPAVLLGSRLAPDMFPLSRQVQVSCDNAKGPLARLAGVEIPKHEDTEKTVDELKARIVKTLDFIGGLDAAKFSGAEDRELTIMIGGKETKMTGRAYLFNRAIPNFMFHVTTAYSILRHNGVEVGKNDFLAG